MVVVPDVPVEECPSCSQIWLTMQVAVNLDSTFNCHLDDGAGERTAAVATNHRTRAAAPLTTCAYPSLVGLAMSVPPPDLR